MPTDEEREKERLANRDRRTKPTEREVELRLAEIPDHDIRTLTQRFFGDPNPADTRRQA